MRRNRCQAEAPSRAAAHEVRRVSAGRGRSPMKTPTICHTAATTPEGRPLVGVEEGDAALGDAQREQHVLMRPTFSSYSQRPDDADRHRHQRVREEDDGAVDPRPRIRLSTRIARRGPARWRSELAMKTTVVSRGSSRRTCRGRAAPRSDQPRERGRPKGRPRLQRQHGVPEQRQDCGRAGREPATARERVQMSIVPRARVHGLLTSDEPVHFPLGLASAAAAGLRPSTAPGARSRTRP